MGVREEEQFPGQPHVSEYQGKKLYPTQNMMVISNEMKALLQKNELSMGKIKDDTKVACMPDEFVKEFTEFLVSSDSACTIEEQEAVIKKIEDVKKYLLQKMFV